MTSYNWQLRYYDTRSNTWSTRNVIPNPNNDITVTPTSTRSTVKLYDGTLGRTIPINKMTYSNVELQWSFISGADILIKDGVQASSLSLRSILSAGYKVEFDTHTLTSGAASVSQAFTGYITEVPKVYKLGLYPTYTRGSETFYDLTCHIDMISIV